MSKRQAIEALANHFFRRGLAVLAEEKPGWIDDVRMPPAIGDNPCNVAIGIETIITEHFRELGTHCSFDLCIGHAEKLHAGGRALLRKGYAGEREWVVHREYHGF